MTTAGIERRTRRTTLWFKGMMSGLKKDGDNFANAAIRAVLQTLKERLPEPEAAQAAAKLPVMLAAIYVSGWHTDSSVQKNRKKFFDQLKTESRGRNLSAEKLTDRLFLLLENYLTPSEVEGLISGLPKDLKNMWPAETEEWPAEMKPRGAGKEKEKLTRIERIRRKLPPVD